MNKLAYTIKQAAHALGIGRTTLYKLIREGRLQPIKIGKRTLIRAEDLRNLIN